jgi:hypothetical protein
MGMRAKRVQLAAMLGLAAVAGGLALAETGATTSAPDATAVELVRRRAELKAGDARGRVALAQWCQGKELWQPMAELSREAAEIDPAGKGAFDLLREYDKLVPLAEDKKLEKTLTDSFSEAVGHAVKCKATRHFLLVYDTTEIFVNARAVQSELAYEAFMSVMDFEKLHPMPPRNRFVMVLFAKRTDFQAYAKLADGNELAWMSGYYSHRTNFVAFFDDSSGQGNAQLEAALAGRNQKIMELNTMIADAGRRGQTGLVNTLTAERNSMELQMDRLRQDFAAQAGKHNAEKTMHETAHQLAFNTGIQLRLVDYPMWLSEGIACQFETAGKAGKLGPEVANVDRLGVLRAAIKTKATIPLEKLIAENPPKDADERTINLWYAESWELVNFLHQEKRAGLEALLQAYKGVGIVHAISAERRKKLFVDAVGEEIGPAETKVWARAMK